MVRAGWKTIVVTKNTHKYLSALKAELEVKSYDQVLLWLVAESKK